MYSLGRPSLLTSNRIYSDLLGKHSSSSRATNIKGQNECFLFTKVPAREGAYERDRREMESLPVKEMAPVKEVEVEPKPKKRKMLELDFDNESDEDGDEDDALDAELRRFEIKF